MVQVLLRLPVGRADAAELSGPTGAASSVLICWGTTTDFS
jgi:hypothetical protein